MRHYNPENILSRAQELPSREFDQEIVLLSIDAGAYYGLEGSARSIWEILKTPLTFSALVDRLVEEYSVSPETCAADLQSFLEKLERKGLLRVE